MIIISFYYLHLSVLYWLSIMHKELSLELMGYMDMILTFKSLQNIKEIRHRDVTSMQAPQGNLIILHTVYKVQREQKSGK